MLECSLDLLDRISSSAYVLTWVLRVFHAQLKLASPVFKSSVCLFEVKASFPDGNSNFVVVELGAVEVKELHQVVAQSQVVSPAFFVFSLQITNHHKCQQK